MSGDVQPRKRKDKRRKKDFASPVQHPDISTSKMVKTDEGLDDLGSANPEEVIHVQKDALLGGNICAKVVFFCLLGAIGVMVGLIIVEYRGSKDVDVHSTTDSPWSQMFEGWVDTSSGHHEDHGQGDEEMEVDDRDYLEKNEVIGEVKDDDEDKDLDNLEDKEEDEEESEALIFTKEAAPGEHQDEEEGEVEEEEETSGVALKFGVGVALVVVAHVVLVRKWNSAGEESAPAVEKGIASSNESVTSSKPELVPESLSRRQTLVPPQAAEEISLVNTPPLMQEPEYSNDEEEGEEEEEEEDEEESENIKQTLQELKETYSHLTPEGSDLEEDEYDVKPASKNYSFTPTPPDSEPEQSEPEAEEEDEEEEEEEDPMRQWQSRQAAHLLAEEVEDVQTGSEEEEESDDEPPPPPPIRRKGPQESDHLDEQSHAPPTYLNAETTNQYDWDFHEELDAADMEINDGGYFR